MSNYQKHRADWTFGLAIIMGLTLGIFIKRVKVGIIIGIVLGGLILLTGWLRKKKEIGMSNPSENRPPIFGNWNAWYWALIIFLLVLIFLFYKLTKSFQ